MPGGPPLLQAIGERDQHHQREERRAANSSTSSGDRQVEERDRGRRLAVVRDEVQEPGERGERPLDRVLRLLRTSGSRHEIPAPPPAAATKRQQRQHHGRCGAAAARGRRTDRPRSRRRGRCTASSRTADRPRSASTIDPHRVRQPDRQARARARGRARATDRRWRPGRAAARRQSPRPLEAARAARPPRGATVAPPRPARQGRVVSIETARSAEPRFHLHLAQAA